MKRLKFFIFAGVLISSLNVSAKQIPAGVWSQTSVSSNAGDCSTCKVNISKPTPHIIQISGNNGWVGYAYYNQSSDSYKGAFEWKSKQGGTYENTIFFMDLTYEGNTITMKARSTRLNFSVTYRK